MLPEYLVQLKTVIKCKQKALDFRVIKVESLKYFMVLYQNEVDEIHFAVKIIAENIRPFLGSQKLFDLVDLNFGKKQELLKFFFKDHTLMVINGMNFFRVKLYKLFGLQINASDYKLQLQKELKNCCECVSLESNQQIKDFIALDEHLLYFLTQDENQCQISFVSQREEPSLEKNCLYEKIKRLNGRFENYQVLQSLPSEQKNLEQLPSLKIFDKLFEQMKEGEKDMDENKLKKICTLSKKYQSVIAEETKILESYLWEQNRVLQILNDKKTTTRNFSDIIMQSVEGQKQQLEEIRQRSEQIGQKMHKIAEHLNAMQDFNNEIEFDQFDEYQKMKTSLEQMKKIKPVENLQKTFESQQQVFSKLLTDPLFEDPSQIKHFNKLAQEVGEFKSFVFDFK